MVGIANIVANVRSEILNKIVEIIYTSEVTKLLLFYCA